MGCRALGVTDQMLAEERDNLQARERLSTDRVQARVVSVPSTNIFSIMSNQYRDLTSCRWEHLSWSSKPAHALGWESYVGPQIAVIGVDILRGVSSRAGRDAALWLHVGKCLQASP